MEGGRAIRSQEVPFTAESGSFTLTSAQQRVSVLAGGSTTVPLTLNEVKQLFYDGVWLSLDVGGAPAGITVRFADDAEGLAMLSIGAPTIDLLIEVDNAVPDGIYPVVITGYNGVTKGALTLQVVVGEVASTIYLPVVVR